MKKKKGTEEGKKMMVMMTIYARDAIIKNRLLDSVGEGKGGMI